MMYGSIFFNCWGALLGFTAYFVTTLLVTTYSPMQIIIGSVVTGIVAFFLMFAFRYLLGYVLYTPEDTVFDDFIVENERIQENNNFVDENKPQDHQPTSTIEYSDESSDEIAKVVRTMLNQDDTVESSY